MEFRANDPGAVQYGNFINYYQFNSAEERLKLMPIDFVWDTVTNLTSAEPYLVLDVGCNSGDFTQLLYKFLKQQINRPIIILGIDIDSILISRAIENNQLTTDDNINFKSLNVMMTSDFQIIHDFLNSHHKNKFDAIFCLSITMWIHLNHADIGLKQFLTNFSEITELLVIEPQPWKCYQTAVKRMKRKANELFPQFSQLLWRHQVEQEIDNFITTQLNQQKIYETPPTKWKRKICFYRHNQNY